MVMVADLRGAEEEGEFKMELKITENKGKIIKFKVSGLDTALANTLRRIIISEIPVMALDEITFEENSSILNDEILAHRLGLLPLKTDLKTYNFMSECDCNFKGCGKCTAILTLNEKGAGTVYSKSLVSNDPKIKPVYDKIPLVKLSENQGVKLEAKAQLGIGKEHIKWQAGLASYEILDEDKFNFFVESYGQLSAKEMIKEAFEIFNKRSSKLEKEVK